MSQCNTLLLEVKQGENRSFGFTVTQNTSSGEVPLNLTNCSIDFEVRKTPYISVTPILTKNVSILENADGFIYNPTQGQFKINLYSTEIDLIPPEDYYISIYVNQDDDVRYSISGEGNMSGILRFCKC